VHFKNRIDKLLVDAIDNNDLEGATKALRNGADPNYVHEGMSLLHYLAVSANVPFVKLLLEAGAEVDSLDDPGGQTPLMWAAITCREGDQLQVMEALIKAGADVNHENENGCTPIECAVNFRNSEAVRALHAAGAQIRHGYKGKIESIVQGKGHAR
jgi:ankyrin repeat protein